MYTFLSVTLRYLLRFSFALVFVICSCVTPAPKSELHPMSHWVRESLDIEKTRKTCRFLGIVTGEDISGSKALMELRSQVAVLKGNTFVIVYDHELRPGRHREIQAEAYLCAGDPPVRP